MYKIIFITKGKSCLVDNADFEKVNKFKWQAAFCKKTNSFYALRKTRKTESFLEHTISMHRFIMDLQHGDQNEIDHINHKTLDNRKENLRICTKSQNQHNREKQINSSSEYKGVFYTDSRTNPWRARIQINGRKMHLGVFPDQTKAFESYKKAHEKYVNEGII
jgi:hypothetical protein